MANKKKNKKAIVPAEPTPFPEKPTVDDLKKLYSSIYYIEDDSIIDVICASVLANRTPGDPVWLAIIGGSSSGKTELINAICGLDFVFQISTLTSNTLLSGMKPRKGQETSLLLQMPRNAIIVMKDLNTFITMNKEDQQAIMGQFLQMYDGEMTKSTGTGDTIKWKGKIGFITGVTEQIHIFQSKYSSFGTRFINYTLKTQDRVKTAQRSSEISAKIKEHRENLKTAFTAYFEYMLPIVAESDHALDPLVSKTIIELSDFAARARSPVARDFQGRMELVMSLEMPMRISNMIHLVGRTFMAMNGGVLSDSHRLTIYKMCLDNIPKGRRLVLDVLAAHGSITTRALSAVLGYDTDRCRMWLEELNVLQICDRERSEGSKGDRWRLKFEYTKLMEVFEGIKSTGEDKKTDNEGAMEDIDNEWDNV